jgi:hypothetical protein
MRLRKILVWGGALVVVLLAGWAGVEAFVIWANLYQAEKESRLFYLPAFALTTDRTPIDFTMRGFVFRIPKAYLTFTHQWEGGPVQEIFLQAILPKLEPPTEHNLDDFKKTGWVDEITISITDAELINDPEFVDSLYLGEIKPETRSKSNHSLLRYEFYHSGGDELYIPAARHPQLRYFTCAIGDKFVVYPSCNASFYLNSKLYIEYSYGKQHLGEWQDVHRQVVSLVSAFIASDPN